MLLTFLHETVGVLPHELAHVVAVRLCRDRIGDVILYGAGGATWSWPGPEGAVAFAGPLATFALAAWWGFLACHVGLVDWSNASPLQELMLCLYVIELSQAVLNLVPLLAALDGANARRALCERDSP